uniref:PLAT domain-containing protein n=1 Tax=Chrysemys picta bellii TaxID=8478 RepID=A0A8C3FSJ8_CHRPI
MAQLWLRGPIPRPESGRGKHRAGCCGEPWARGCSQSHPPRAGRGSAVDEYQMPRAQCLGPIMLIRLHKEPYSFFPSDSWLCNCVQVMSPEGDTYRFPCYQWIEGYRTVELQEGAGRFPKPIPPLHTRDYRPCLPTGFTLSPSLGLLTPPALAYI